METEISEIKSSLANMPLALKAEIKDLFNIKFEKIAEAISSNKHRVETVERENLRLFEITDSFREVIPLLKQNLERMPKLESDIDRLDDDIQKMNTKIEIMTAQKKSLKDHWAFNFAIITVIILAFEAFKKFNV